MNTRSKTKDKRKEPSITTSQPPMTAAQSSTAASQSSQETPAKKRKLYKASAKHSSNNNNSLQDSADDSDQAQASSTQAASQSSQETPDKKRKLYKVSAKHSSNNNNSLQDSADDSDQAQVQSDNNSSIQPATQIVNLVPQNTNKKKRKTGKDGGYNPKKDKKQKNSNNNSELNLHNPMFGRPDNSKFTDENNTDPLAFGVIFNKEGLTQEGNIDLFGKPELIDYIEHYLEKISAHRFLQVTKVNPKSGSPIKAVTLTPRKREMNVRLKTNVLWFLTNQEQQPSVESIKEISADNKFLQSADYAKVLKITEDIKEFKIKVTQKLLEKTAKENKDSSSRNQNAEMAAEGYKPADASASKYANSSKLFKISNVKWEWAHLVAHMILGAASQTHKNMAATTEFSNTVMMLTEPEIRTISKAYPDGFDLHVKASLIPGTHIGIEIDYAIITKDFTLRFKFNAQESVKPHMLYRKVLHIFTKALVNYAEHSAVKGNSPDKTKAANNNVNNNNNNSVNNNVNNNNNNSSVNNNLNNNNNNNSVNNNVNNNNNNSVSTSRLSIFQKANTQKSPSKKPSQTPQKPAVKKSPQTPKKPQTPKSPQTPKTPQTSQGGQNSSLQSSKRSIKKSLF